MLRKLSIADAVKLNSRFTQERLNGWLVVGWLVSWLLGCLADRLVTLLNVPSHTGKDQRQGY